MRADTAFIISLVSFVLVIALSGASTVVGTASVHAPAVIISNNSGTITTIALTVTSGTGNVSVIGPSSVASSTLDSAKTAVQYATGSLGMNESAYNFTYDIEDINTSVSGPSAGAAMTLLAVSALSHRQINNGITLTGTISPNGTIGQIGGVYDKISAASLNGVRYAFVPYAANGTGETELYYLVQQEFGIPLVRVQNMTQLESYAFNASFNPYTHETNYSIYSNYHIAEIPNANISCSNSCNTKGFSSITNQTIALTNSEILALSSDSSFRALAGNMEAMLNQSRQISGKGYMYLGDDVAFLTYIDAYYFSHHTISRSESLSVMQNVSNYCSEVTPPAITAGNYEYVLGGELRQAWGQYTINITLAGYNSTLNSDELLAEMGLSGEASGWCAASRYMYNAVLAGGNTVIGFNSTILKPVAEQYLSAAANYSSSMYYITASAAYSKGNYALATMDAAYAIGLDSVPTPNASAAQIAASAASLLASSNYGVWATQFSNEAEFYIHETSIANNSSAAYGYAYSAYTTAMLAHEISSATSAVNSSIAPASSLPPQTATQAPSGLVLAVAALAILALVISFITLFMVLRLSRKVRRNGAGRDGRASARSRGAHAQRRSARNR